MGKGRPTDALTFPEPGEGALHSAVIGLQDLLQQQARCDPRRRAWKRIQAALDAHQLPDDADMRLLTASRASDGELAR
jgi:hypothetical protein